MPVELAPIGELDIDEAIREFAVAPYCANCVHFTPKARAPPSFRDEPSCGLWQDATRIEPGYVCPASVPQGYD